MFGKLCKKKFTAAKSNSSILEPLQIRRNPYGTPDIFLVMIRTKDAAIALANFLKGYARNSADIDKEIINGNFQLPYECAYSADTLSLDLVYHLTEHFIKVYNKAEIDENRSIISYGLIKFLMKRNRFNIYKTIFDIVDIVTFHCERE